MKCSLRIAFAKYTAYTILSAGEIDLRSAHEFLQTQPFLILENEVLLPQKGLYM